jgi:hypothetical protein
MIQDQEETLGKPRISSKEQQDIAMPQNPDTRKPKK